MKRSVLILFLILCGAVCFAAPVEIDFFFEPGCHECERIEAELLPKVEEQFGEDCIIRAHDIGIETNFIYLLQLENALGHMGPDRGYLIVNKQFLFGSNPSHEEFLSLVSDLVGQASLQTESLCSSHAPEYGKRVLQSEEIVKERFSGFTVGAVLIAGLLDGLNPCAISTLVFFMSLLTVSGIRNRQLLLLGGSFCLASLITYLVLGFGLLRVLHLFAGFKTIRAVIEWGMVAALAFLAGLSFLDALRFRNSGQANDVTLQLSSRMKKRIHGVMRRGLKKAPYNPPRPPSSSPEKGNPNAWNHNPLLWRGAGLVRRSLGEGGTTGWVPLVLGGLFIGAAVTALESVCTGQVYVPTLVLILKENASQGRAWVLLLLYNLLFILPLVVVFIAVYRGLRTETLLDWSRKNVVVSKLCLAIFFVLMAVLILFV